MKDFLVAFLVAGFFLSLVVTVTAVIALSADKRANAPCNDFNNTPARDVPLRCLERLNK